MSKAQLYKSPAWSKIPLIHRKFYGYRMRKAIQSVPLDQKLALRDLAERGPTFDNFGEGGDPRKDSELMAGNSGPD
jgi:hypothetical protein